MNTTPNPRILFLSNGHGEDLIASRIIEELRLARPDWRLTAFPLVGQGEIYDQKNIQAVGPRRTMPSGGFIVGLPAILRDIRAGLAGLVWGQLMTCRKMRPGTDLVVAVGDVYPLFLGARFVKKPMIFLPTAISHHVGAHNQREKKLMDRFALAVFPRDEKTAQELARAGIKARFLGNVMMDCLSIKTENSKYFEADYRLAILPGSREEAYNKLSVILPAVEELAARARGSGQKIIFSLAKSGQIKLEKMALAAAAKGWSLDQEKNGFYKACLIKDKVKIGIVEGALGDILANSDAVLGLAGTANEQAVGLGKIVVAFYDQGPQITKRFLDNQANLLGGAVLVIPPEVESVANKIWSVLTEPQKYQVLIKNGQSRMTGVGSSRRIAEAIVVATRQLGSIQA